MLPIMSLVAEYSVLKISESLDSDIKSEERMLVWVT